ncbi:uncharacterized protein LOC129586680 [Paramacrobiotus metropolitanus]|uniref:uncharacterized protein LOC129586680 n=1 Tax=Paramacrobiotus metropolitanus TaxID=2943436 RepID=UPI002445B2C8|nr:uncharacterized protein LOC129586680 [Paramacrobiotus metropolitanus]XP_055335985.1 uncharacterized protein LOC129586680 [Paramacrobiotus metropolitanus]XP_055335986.1 uncharacterized protein LOC129586680 [Paramacrobiotus metropolitanus]XP_055335987.1 uncharacterized protein LOC129586680 [Paramacrobiotus metropolitanus]XP_055335988.1 uncharacterized protein LOC129586680 [Paramacrobiotus metropolitanus]XP_055335989.1 uncharacterized protein LOC129586680 [Paramacrobiotus metropolitanus]XP_05
MRFLRKTAYLSPSKFGRIFIAVLLSTMCVMGLKSFLSLEEISAKKAVIVPRNTSDQSSELQLNDDAPPSALKTPNEEEMQLAGNDLMDKINGADANEALYPGWREEDDERHNPTLTAAQPSIMEEESVKKKKVDGRFLSQGQFIRPFPGMDINSEPPRPLTSFEAFQTKPPPPTPVPLASGQELLHGPAATRAPIPAVEVYAQQGVTLPSGPVGNAHTNPPWPGMQLNQQMSFQPGTFTLKPWIVQQLQQRGDVPQNQNQLVSQQPQFINTASNMPGLPGIVQAVQTGFQPPPPPPNYNPNFRIQERVVHFDLKGAPFKLSYYKEVFPLIRKLGGTGLLMEYEDMFPYSGRFKVANAGNAYTISDIQQINRLAEENELYVIPLVQTFGHLEFVLKHKEFKQFREVEAYASAVCPTRNGTLDLVTEMVEQMLHLHPNATYLHIGADEVYHLGQCPVCRAQTQNNYFIGRQNLFLSHVAQVLHFLRTKYPHIRPIMWDDMFHNMHEDTIRNGLGDLVNHVEIMIWSYFTEWTRHLPRNGDLYGPVFPNIWGATAFKGSDGESRQMPDVKTQLEIHTSWIEALKVNGYKLQNFRGIVLSGWSRYDHFYPLCELFPLAVPSLAINLQVLLTGEYNVPVIEQVAKILSCDTIRISTDFLTFDPTAEQFNTCQFPGVDVFRVVHLVEGIRKPVKDFLEELTNRYPEYQMRHQYMQIWRGEEQINKINSYLYLYTGYLSRAKDAFLQVYDENTLNEWIAGSVDPSIKKLTAWRTIFESVMNMEEWQSRPLNIPTLPPPELPSTTLPPINPFFPGWNPPQPLIPLPGSLPQFGNNSVPNVLPPQPHLQRQVSGPIPVQMPLALNQPLFQPHWANNVGGPNQSFVDVRQPQGPQLFFGK